MSSSGEESSPPPASNGHHVEGPDNTTAAGPASACDVAGSVAERLSELQLQSHKLRSPTYCWCDQLAHSLRCKVCMLGVYGVK